jgi:hypothetical protein
VCSFDFALSRVKHQQEKTQGHCKLPEARILRCDEIVKIRNLRGHFAFYSKAGERISNLWGDVRGLADTSALAAIHRALRFTWKDIDPGEIVTDL